MLSYLYYGYHTAITCLWILSIILVGVYFFKISPKKSQESFSGKDVITAIILTAIISIFYFSVGPEYPLQMVGDEVSITVKSIVLSQPGVDLFKPSDYYNLPAPFFAISGHFASLFGPIDVLNIRLIHTALGVIISILSFFLFRRIFPDFFRAILATLLISAQHSLFAISHLGILTNSAVLTYLISLLFLLTGLTKNSKGLSFIGGVVAGLGWYVYSPAKSIIVIWLLSLAIIAILCRINYLKKINLKTVIPATLIGFILAVCPFIIGAATTPQKGDTTWYYQQSQFLFHETSLRYSKKDSIFETVKSNAIDGLSTFNRNLQDRGYMYNHWEKNGFADPLTGIFSVDRRTVRSSDTAKTENRNCNYYNPLPAPSLHLHVYSQSRTELYQTSDYATAHNPTYYYRNTGNNNKSDFIFLKRKTAQNNSDAVSGNCNSSYYFSEHRYFQGVHTNGRNGKRTDRRYSSAHTQSTGTEMVYIQSK